MQNTKQEIRKHVTDRVNLIVDALVPTILEVRDTLNATDTEMVVALFGGIFAFSSAGAKQIGDTLPTDSNILVTSRMLVERPALLAAAMLAMSRELCEAMVEAKVQQITASN